MVCGASKTEVKPDSVTRNDICGVSHFERIRFAVSERINETQKCNTKIH